MSEQSIPFYFHAMKGFVNCSVFFSVLSFIPQPAILNPLQLPLLIYAVLQTYKFGELTMPFTKLYSLYLEFFPLLYSYFSIQSKDPGPSLPPPPLPPSLLCLSSDLYFQLPRKCSTWIFHRLLRFLMSKTENISSPPNQLIPPWALFQ